MALPTFQAADAAQEVKAVIAEFSVGDTLKDSTGAVTSVNDKGTTSTTYPVARLPKGAQVVGGFVQTPSAITGPTEFDVSLGTTVGGAQLLAATDHVTAKATALITAVTVPDTGVIYVTIAPTVAAATAGKVRVVIQYVVGDNANFVTA